MEKAEAVAEYYHDIEEERGDVNREMHGVYDVKNRKRYFSRGSVNEGEVKYILGKQSPGWATKCRYFEQE